MKPILLIDLSAIFRSAWHANENGPMSVAMEATLDGGASLQGASTGFSCGNLLRWKRELEERTQRGL